MLKPKLPITSFQGIPLSPDDSILIESIYSFTNCTLNIQGTAINLLGELVNFNEILILSTPATLTQKICQLGYSFLLSVQVSTFSLLVPETDVYVRVSLINPNTVQPYFRRMILSQGYVSTYSGISFGHGSFSTTDSDRYTNYTINPSNPAAGAEINYAVPSFCEMMLYQASYLFTPSAAVATRFSRLQIQDITGNTFNAPQTVSCAASTARRHTWGMSPSTGTVVTSEVGNFLSPIPLRSGCSIRTFTEAIQAADQYSAISFLIKYRTVPFT